MGKYSSDSESSASTKKKKVSKSHRRSSSRSSSESRYSSRCRKKKYKKSSKRSRSRDKSKERGRRRRSRSRQRRRRIRRSRSKSRRRRKSSSSGSRSPAAGDEGRDLLMKLNRAAERAMAEKSRPATPPDPLVAQLNRERAIEDINAPMFLQKAFTSKTTSEVPTVVDVTHPVLPTPLPSLELKDSLLHPNLLMEQQEEKLNRWVKKLFQIRQRSINGEPLDLA